MSPPLDAKARDFIFGVAVKVVRNDDDAHDVTQDALLLAWRKRESYRGEAAFTTWLYQVTMNAALHFLRRAKRRSTAIPLVTPREGDEGFDAPCAKSSPEALAAAREEVRQVTKKLSSVTAVNAEIFRRRFADRETPEVVAARLDMKPATVKSRAYRMRAMVTR